MPLISSPHKRSNEAGLSYESATSHSSRKPPNMKKTNILRQPHLLSSSNFGRKHQIVRQPHLANTPHTARQLHVTRQPHLMRQPHLESQPHLVKQLYLVKKLFLATQPSLVDSLILWSLSGCLILWGRPIMRQNLDFLLTTSGSNLTGSSLGLRWFCEVPATISMSGQLLLDENYRQEKKERKTLFIMVLHSAWNTKHMHFNRPTSDTFIIVWYFAWYLINWLCFQIFKFEATLIKVHAKQSLSIAWNKIKTHMYSS